jgi:integral membrane protein (TIGR01906 family)
MVRLARILLIVCVPVLLVATPLYLLVRPGYAHRAYARPAFPESVRFTREERQRLSDTLIDFLRGRVTLEEMAALRTDAGAVALTAEEVEHMADVKQVTDGFFLAHGVALALAALASLLLLRSRPLAWAHGIRLGIGVTVGLIALVAVTALADFDLFFTFFHRIFFQEGTWTFPWEDTLIQLYPLPFWTRAVLDFSLAIVAGAVVLYLASRWVEARALRGEP